MITGLAVLPTDFFLSGISVYLLEDLRAPPWLPGAVLALATGLSSAGATAALRVTRRMRRTTAMALGAALFAAWSAASLAALAVPSGWRPAEVLAATVVMAAGGLLFQSRVNALAEATAPAAARGRYLAAFQYAFTVPGVLAPAVVALFPVAVWLPWLLVGAAAGLAVLGLRILGGHLPAAALRPGQTWPRRPSEPGFLRQGRPGGRRGQHAEAAADPAGGPDQPRLARGPAADLRDRLAGGAPGTQCAISRGARGRRGRRPHPGTEVRGEDEPLAAVGAGRFSWRLCARSAAAARRTRAGGRAQREDARLLPADVEDRMARCGACGPSWTCSSVTTTSSRPGSGRQVCVEPPHGQDRCPARRGRVRSETSSTTRPASS